MVQLSLSDSLALLGLAVTVVLWAIAPTPVLRIVALAFAWALVLLAVFALPGLKEIDWTAKVLITVGATLVAAGLAYTPIRDRVLHLAPTSSVAPSTPVYLHMEYANKAFNIFNDGTANLKLCGTRFDDGPISIDVPRIISPNGGAYHIYISTIEPEILAKIPDGHDVRVPFDLYLENEVDDKYIARFELWIRVVKRTIAIDTQLLSISKEDWQASRTAAPTTPHTAVQLALVLSGGGVAGRSGRIVIRNPGPTEVEHLRLWGFVRFVGEGRGIEFRGDPPQTTSEASLENGTEISYAISDLIALRRPAAPKRAVVESIYLYYVYTEQGFVTEREEAFTFVPPSKLYVGLRVDYFPQRTVLKAIGRKVCAYQNLLTGRQATSATRGLRWRAADLSGFVGDMFMEFVNLHGYTRADAPPTEFERAAARLFRDVYQVEALATLTDLAAVQVEDRILEALVSSGPEKLEDLATIAKRFWTISEGLK